MKRFILIVFLYCLLLGASVRLFGLGSNPLGFFCDEASIGYNAYLILHTGHDEYAAFLPLFYKAFGEYKNPVALYATIPSIALFDLNEFATRLPSALFGIGTLIALYFLLKQTFLHEDNQKQLTLWGVFLLAISPWHIFISRVALEGLMPYVFFCVLGTYYFLRRNDHHFFLVGSSICFALSLYSYFPARIFIPLFLLCLFFLFFKSLWQEKKQTCIAASVFFLLCIPLGITYVSGQGFSRFQQVSIFSHPPKEQTVLHHILINYMSHFSPDFLFMKGDSGMPGQVVTRHSVRGFGELYMLQAPFLLLGIFFLFKKGTSNQLIFLFWLLLYPTGSMLTTDLSAQATRSIIGVIPLQVITAIGIWYAVSWIKKKPWQYVLTISLLFLFHLSFVQYAIAYHSYQTYSSGFWGWQYGPSKIVPYLVSQQETYDELYFPPTFNAPSIFLKFYAPTSCQRCYVGYPDQVFNPEKRQLFAIDQEYLLSHPSLQIEMKKIIYYPDNTRAFIIGEVKKVF